MIRFGGVFAILVAIMAMITRTISMIMFLVEVLDAQQEIMFWVRTGAFYFTDCLVYLALFFAGLALLFVSGKLRNSQAPGVAPSLHPQMPPKQMG